MSADRRRLLIRALAAQAHINVAVRASAGATCLLCLTAIAPGARQYEIELGQSVMIVDERCYKASLQDIVDAPPDAAI